MAKDHVEINIKAKTKEATQNLKKFSRETFDGFKRIKTGSRDASEGLKRIKRSSRDAADGLKTASGGTKGFIASLGKLKAAIGATVAAAIAFKAFRGVTRFLGESAAEAEKEQWAMRGLHQVLVSMGRYTPQFEKSLLDLADAFEVQTGYGNDAIITATKFLSTYQQISNDVLPRALKLTLDIARGWGVELRSAANMVGKAAMGMTGELRRYGITVDQDVYKTRGFIGVMEQIEEQVKGQAAAYRETSQGIREFLATAWSDVKKQFGYLVNEVLAPLRETVGQILIDLAGRFKEWRQDVDLKEWAEAQAERLRAWYDYVVDVFVPGIKQAFSDLGVTLQKVKNTTSWIIKALTMDFDGMATEIAKKAAGLDKKLKDEPIEPNVDIEQSKAALDEFEAWYWAKKRRIESEPIRIRIKREVVTPEGTLGTEYETYRRGGFAGYKFQHGGFVPGMGYKDSVRAMLRPGEGVVPVESVNYYGRDLIRGIINRTIPRVSDRVVVDFRLGEGSYPVTAEKSDVLSALLKELKRNELTQG